MEVRERLDGIIRLDCPYLFFFLFLSVFFFCFFFFFLFLFLLFPFSFFFFFFSFFFVSLFPSFLLFYFPLSERLTKQETNGGHCSVPSQQRALWSATTELRARPTTIPPPLAEHGPVSASIELAIEPASGFQQGNSVTWMGNGSGSSSSGFGVINQ